MRFIVDGINVWFIDGSETGKAVGFDSVQDWFGERWVIFEATDSGGLSLKGNNMTLVVNGVNDAPVIQDEDVVIFMNFRSDRARQLTRALIDPNFTAFKRQYIPKNLTFISYNQ